jgi:ABC-2 type transport system permease protein
MWLRVLALTIKEFLVLLKDPRSRSVIIVPPFVQLLVFSFAASYDLDDIPFAVYDEDSGAQSHELLAGFRNSRHFHETDSIANDGEIAPLIDSKKVLLVLHIGPTFSRDLAAGRTATVQAIVDGRNSNTAMIALGYASGIVERFNAQWGPSRGYPGASSRLETRAWFNPNLQSRWFIVPGIVGLLTLVVTMLVTALSVAREREQGTFDQILVAPFRPVEILLGKAIPGFLIGLMESSGIILVAVFGFRIPLLGSLLTLYTGLVLFLVSAVGVGLLISSLAVTQQQGLLGAFMFLVPAILLSGFATPIVNMPPWMQKATVINPMRYFLVILRGVFLEGASFNVLADQFWPMAAIGAITLIFAAWLFRGRLY